MGWRPRTWRPLIPLLYVGAVGSVLLACAGDTTDPTSLSPARTYWALRLNVHAVNMATVAPHDTLQLTATPRNAAGDVLSGIGAVTYTTADSSVTVSPTGLVTARYNTYQNGRTFVVASLHSTTLNLTHADTVFIQVTDTVPHSGLATFSIQPLQGDSAKRALDLPSNLQWPVFATDSAGTPVCTATLDAANYTPSCALQVYFTSSDPTVATIDRASGQVTQLRVGHVTFYATTRVYGKIWSDSLPFVVGWGVQQGVTSTWVTPAASLTPSLTFVPAKIIVGIGAIVLWSNQDPGDSADVVFDDPAAARSACGGIPGIPFLAPPNCAFFPATGSGDIPPFARDTTLHPTDLAGFLAQIGTSMRARSFVQAGTYSYHSRRYPSATGEIIVRQDP